MKLSNRDTEIVSNGNIGTSIKMSIAATPKVLRLLSDAMYKDKIGSMVRELCCNAADAHIKAGTPELPFTVHLPNTLEPWFSVKDTGVGIDPYNMAHVYAVMGESTKEESNDEVGAFGLGSKTPFAYTDQFVVESIVDGVKRGYVNIIAETINLQSEEPTDEHDGLTVTVAVNTEDFYRFNRAIVEQLQFFKVKPLLQNNLNNIKLEDINTHEHIIISNDAITLFNTMYTKDNGGKGLWIVQGGVSYRLELNQLSGIDPKLSTFVNALEHHYAFMVFPVGDIQVIPSREGISYTEEVIATIIARLKIVWHTITTQAIESLKQEKHVWDRVVLFNSKIRVVRAAIEQLPIMEVLFPEKYVCIEKRHEPLTINLEEFHTTLCAATLMINSLHWSNARGRSHFTLKRRTKYSVKSWGTSAIEPGDTPGEPLEIYLRDTKSKPLARLRHMLDIDTKEFLLIENADSVFDSALISEIAVSLQISEDRIKRVSDLPAPKIDSPKRGLKSKAYKYRMSAGLSGHSSKEWDCIYDLSELDDGTIWTEMSNHTINSSPLDLEDWNIFMRMHVNKVTTDDVIAVNSQTANRIRDGKIGENLVHWSDAYKPIAAEVKALEPTMKTLQSLIGYIDCISRENMLVELHENGISIDVLNRVPVVKKRLQQLRERTAKFKWLYQPRSEQSEDKSNGYNKAAARIEAYKEKYPLIDMVTLNYGKREQQILNLVDYVKLLDNGT